jgi:hypothetical protein
MVQTWLNPSWPIADEEITGRAAVLTPAMKPGAPKRQPRNKSSGYVGDTVPIGIVQVIAKSPAVLSQNEPAAGYHRYAPKREAISYTGH